MAQAENTGHRDVVEHKAGGEGESSLFNLRSLMKSGLDPTKASTGGEMGANFNGPVAEAAINTGLTVPNTEAIYSSTAFN
jgi:hypothetical protein